MKFFNKIKKAKLSNLRNPWTLFISAIVLSGFIRGIVCELFHCENLDGMLGNVSRFLASCITGNTFWQAVLACLIQMCTCVAFVSGSAWLVCGIVFRIPGFTKALYWAIIRSYEHHVSRNEALLLLSLPFFIAVATFSQGYCSLASLLMFGTALMYHFSAYNLKRLKKKTDEDMSTRSLLKLNDPSWVQDPPERIQEI